jgi:hypothetical protein
MTVDLLNMTHSVVDNNVKGVYGRRKGADDKVALIIVRNSYLCNSGAVFNLRIARWQSEKQPCSR